MFAVYQNLLMLNVCWYNTLSYETSEMMVLNSLNHVINFTFWVHNLLYLHLIEFFLLLS